MKNITSGKPIIILPHYRHTRTLLPFSPRALPKLGFPQKCRLSLYFTLLRSTSLPSLTGPKFGPLFFIPLTFRGYLIAAHSVWPGSDSGLSIPMVLTLLLGTSLVEWKPFFIRLPMPPCRLVTVNRAATGFLGLLIIWRLF